MKNMPKEKTDRQLTVMVKPSLYEVLVVKCEQEHRSVSEVVRELISKYSAGWVQLPANNTREPTVGIIDHEIGLANRWSEDDKYIDKDAWGKM